MFLCWEVHIEPPIIVIAKLFPNRFLPNQKAYFCKLSAPYPRSVLILVYVKDLFYMGLINDCAKLFSKYIGYNYTLELDCCYSIEVAFKSDQFHHLIGLHYLEDTKEVNSKIETNSPKRIFKNIISNKITQESIEKSKQYYKIKERVENFLLFDNVINCKIIIDFDYTKVPHTKITSKYLLYTKSNGKYIILGLRYSNNTKSLVPETFIVENTDYYIKNQISYEIIGLSKEKVTKKKK